MMLSKYKNKIGLGLVLYFSLVGACFAEKLEIVVAKTIATNPSILSQNARKYAQDNKLQESLSGYFPKIDLAAAYGRERNVNYFTRQESPSNPALTLTRREAGFSIKQMVFDGFAVRSEIEADSALVQSSRHHIAATLEDVILQVTAAYIETIMQRSIFIHAKESSTNHQQILEQLASGKIPNVNSGDLALARSRVALSQSIMLDLQNDIRISQADYIKVVGEKPGVMFRPEAPDKKLPTNEDAAVALAINTHPLVAIDNAEIRAARAEKRVAKSGFFPKIDLELYGSNNKNVDGVTQTTNNMGAMLQMKYNLFRGGKDIASERRSAWMLEEKKQSLNQDLRIIEQSIRRAWSDFVNYKGQLQPLKKRVDAMTKTREAYYEEFVNGHGRVLDLLDAEHELYAAKAMYVAAQYKELLSRFLILHSMGKLREYFNVQNYTGKDYTGTPWLNGF